MKLITDGTKTISVPHGAQYSTPFAFKISNGKLEFFFGGSKEQLYISREQITLKDINAFLLSESRFLEV